jgi:hypothetical protein
MFQELSGHPAAQQPRLYRDYAVTVPSLLRHAHTLEQMRGDAAAQAKVRAAATRLGVPDQALRWLPLDSSRGSAVQLIAAADAQPLATVAVDPWALLPPAPARQRGATATPAEHAVQRH